MPSGKIHTVARDPSHGSYSCFPSYSHVVVVVVVVAVVAATAAAAVTTAVAVAIA